MQTQDECLYNYYYFDLRDCHEKIYEAALFNNDKREFCGKENIFTSLLNYYLRNNVRDSFIIDEKRHLLLDGLKIDCRSPVENFSDYSLDILMDLVHEMVWNRIEMVIPVTLRTFPIGYSIIDAGFLCLAVDKREEEYANKSHLSFDARRVDCCDRIPYGGIFGDGLRFNLFDDSEQYLQLFQDWD